MVELGVRMSPLRGVYPSPLGRGQGEGALIVLAADVLVVMAYL